MSATNTYHRRNEVWEPMKLSPGTQGHHLGSQAPTGLSLAIIGLLAVRCSPQIEPDCGAADGKSTCVPANDRNRRIYADGCNSYENCEPGLACVGNAGEDARTTCGGKCALIEYNPKVHDRALLEGFAVSPFPLSLSESGSPVTVTWTPMDNFRFVACAVFTCPPRIASTIIVNPECILQGAIYRPETLSFLVELKAPHNIDTTKEAIKPPECTPSDGHEGFQDQPASMAVGCWAYNDTDVIAATKLLSIDPTLLVPSFGESAPFADFTPVCTPSDNGKWCTYSAVPQILGTCWSGACRQRCVCNDDGDQASGGVCGQTGDAVARSCYCDDLRRLGICLDDDASSTATTDTDDPTSESGDESAGATG